MKALVPESRAQDNSLCSGDPPIKVETSSIVWATLHVLSIGLDAIHVPRVRGQDFEAGFQEGFNML